jgi:hypothetical protein
MVNSQLVNPMSFKSRNFSGLPFAKTWLKEMRQEFVNKTFINLSNLQNPIVIITDIRFKKFKKTKT